MFLRSQKHSRKRNRHSRYSFYKRKFRANPIFKKSSSQKGKPRKKILGYLIFCILLGGVWFLFFSKIFALTNIIIESENVTTREKAKEIIGDVLSKKQWDFISRSNIFLVPKSEIGDELHKQFFIEELVFRKRFPNTIVIILKEKESHIELFTQSQRFLLDNEGRVIREVPQIIEALEDPAFSLEKETSHNIIDEKIEKSTGDETSLKETPPQKDFFKERVIMEGDNMVIYLMESSIIVSGDQIFTSDDISHISDMLSVSKNIIGMPLLYITFPKQTESEIRLKTKEDWEIVFDLKKDIPKQLQNFELVYKEKFLEKREELHYIDLRFDERVYYK